MNAETGNKDPDTLVNIHAIETAPHTVAGDGQCGNVTYHTPPGAGEVVAPFGSSNGRNALKASVLNGDGCIDIARSSGAPRAVGTDLASFEYYAYALDAFGWSSASTHAPTNVSLAQLKSVYNCTFTDWSQVGGSAGPIQRYEPQTGSGSFQTFSTFVLGFDPGTFSSGSCPAVIQSEENVGTLIAANGDQPTAIMGYSAGDWIAQARGTVTDKRAGQVEKSLNGQAIVTFPGGVPTLNEAPGPVTEDNVPINDPTPAYPGIRYLYNVIDNTGVSYKDAKFFVGFENKRLGRLEQSDCQQAVQRCVCLDHRKLRLRASGCDAAVPPHNQLGKNCRLYTP